ncbi:MAG: hypothetical protein JW871_04855 [Endomicrobiales bacterium]|nr:hypothetical protein [Endomicrobiales bacterium]
MHIFNKKSYRFLITALACAWFCVFLAKEIDLTRNDIGRHLKSGELIFEFIRTYPLDLIKSGIVNNNYFSYTYPDLPAINHQWGSGLILFIIEKISGFKGLSIFYIFLSLVTFFLFFKLSEKKSSFNIAILVSVLLIPLIADRNDINPAAFSYFFCALFYLILEKYKQGNISRKMLFVLPILGIIWVNMHVYFIIGILIVGAFLSGELISFFAGKENKLKDYFIIFFLVILSSLINPFGLKGVLSPLHIFKNYGYRIFEYQPLCFGEYFGAVNPNFLIFKVSFVILIISFILIITYNFQFFPTADLILSITLGVVACMDIKNFAVYGFFALPIISKNIQLGLGRKIELNSPRIKFYLFLFTIIALIFNIFRTDQYLSSYWKNIRLGIIPGNKMSARFFKTLNIQGPVLNNYDIGGYLIYYLYPEHRVFVDSRPTEYPESFFKDVYVPMLEDGDVFRYYEELYKINSIYFSYHGLAPWEQNFLIKCIHENVWVPVFADNYAIIFLKRNATNKPIIDEYEIPKDYFIIRQLNQ